MRIRITVDVAYGTKIETATKLKGLIVEKFIGCINFNSVVNLVINY